MRDASLQQRGNGEGQPGQEGLEAFPAIPSKCVPEGRRAACASGMFSCSELSPILLFSAAAEGKRPRLTLMCLSGRSKTGERSGRPLSLPNSELADQVHFFASADCPPREIWKRSVAVRKLSIESRRHGSMRTPTRGPRTHLGHLGCPCARPRGNG